MKAVASYQSQNIHLSVEKDKAVVLLGLVNKLNNSQITLDHPAERKVLWDLECMLAGVVEEARQTDFHSRLHRAREATWPTRRRTAQNLSRESLTPEGSVEDTLVISA